MTTERLVSRSRVFQAALLAAATLGCASTSREIAPSDLEDLRGSAALQFDCPKSQITVERVGENEYMASGCGKKSPYSRYSRSQAMQTFLADVRGNRVPQVRASMPVLRKGMPSDDWRHLLEQGRAIAKERGYAEMASVLASTGNDAESAPGPTPVVEASPGRSPATATGPGEASACEAYVRIAKVCYDSADLGCGELAARVLGRMGSGSEEELETAAAAAEICQSACRLRLGGVAWSEVNARIGCHGPGH